MQRSLRWATTAPLAAALAAAVLGVGGAAGTGTRKQLTPQEIAQKLLDSHAAGLMTSSAQSALQMIASGNQTFSKKLQTQAPPARQLTPGQIIAGFFPRKNVLVNDPQEDTKAPYGPNQIDQTTQSETSVAVSGNNVVVGFNDSLNTLLFLTAGTNLSGYSYSPNKGDSFVDGTVIPNRPGDQNFGDPWLASDPAGNFYYSTLYNSLRPERSALDVGVAKSTDGGKTFTPPVTVDTQAQEDPFYLADKDALASGPRPAGTPGQALYDAWDDFKFDPNAFQPVNGLPVSHSYDDGQTWTVTYADQLPVTDTGCSFEQYIGAYPYVDPPTGTVYVATEKLSVDNPDCNFDPEPPLIREEWIFRSDDGGQTWPLKARISEVAESAPPNGLVFLGPGMYMRNLEFPTVASTSTGVYVAWNDGGLGGKSHVRLAKSVDRGQTWATYFTTPEDTNDEYQPAMTGDARGLHILHYVRNPDLTLDTYVQNSATGAPGTFAAARVSNRSFPGVFTFPPFDPIIAFGYMGDYIGQATDGSHQYFAWGDNRNKITNFLYPKGRNDPDVFAARQ